MAPTAKFPTTTRVIVECIECGHCRVAPAMVAPTEAGRKFLPFQQWRTCSDCLSEGWVVHELTPVVKQPKTGRNAPCPCGSGKKFKRCCLDPTSQRAA